MAATFDTSSSNGNTTPASSYSFSATVNSGSNRLLIVGFNAFNQVGVNNSIAVSVKFNGVAMTRAVTQFLTNGSSFDLSTDIWYLINPTVQTANVVGDFSGGSGGGITSFHGYAASYFGMQQSSPVDATLPQNITSPTTHVTGSVTTTQSGDVLADVLSAGGQAFSADAGQTTLMTFATTDRGSYEIAGAAGSTAMGWTAGVADTATHVIAAFLAASTATTTIAPTHMMLGMGG